MYSMLYATAASENEAAGIAKHLLRKRLIACANIYRIRSLFRWNGKVHDEGEFALIMKTKTALVKKAIAEAAKIHSYGVPCIVSYRMGDGLPSYLKWIASETRQSKK